jgi:hypothetical protein
VLQRRRPGSSRSTVPSWGVGAFLTHAGAKSFHASVRKKRPQAGGQGAANLWGMRFTPKGWIRMGASQGSNL